MPADAPEIPQETGTTEGQSVAPNGTPADVAQVAGGPQVRVQMHAQELTQQFTGPLPHPTILAQYEALFPGTADRIIRMAELEGDHRRQQDALVVQSNIEGQSRQIDIATMQTRMSFRSDAIGQFLGGLVSLASLAGCVYLAVHGHEWVAGSMLALPLAGIIRALRERNGGASAPSG